MWKLGSILILLLVCSFSCTYVLLDDDEPTEDITWPSEYYFKGQSSDISTGIVHPFRIWYSAEYNRSRMELFDGEINSYYVSASDNERGGEYKVLTVTTAELTNTIQCMMTSSYDEEQKDFLPETSSMNNTGSFTLNGREIQEWKRTVEEDGVFRIEDNLLVYRMSGGIDIPVQHERKKYDLDAGRLLDHTVVEYFDFKPSVNVEDLEFSDEKDCEELSTDFSKNLNFLHPSVESDLDIAFEGYKKHHNKKYKNNEMALRKMIFHKNWRLVTNHNRQNLSYKLAMNQFADRSDEELSFLTGTRPSPDSKGTHTFLSLEEVDDMVDELPEEFDLRLKGVMRPVKRQGQCGSCWAFSSTAAVEGAISYGLGGRNVELSEQSLVDCAWGYDNYGCMGGTLDGVFKYILDHGIPAGVDYGQYREVEGQCHIQNLTSVFKIRGFGKVNRNSINSIKLALNKYGPVTVSVRATANMKLYSSGVFFDVDCKYGNPNHGVVIVGYGVRNGDSYFIVRNSWGEEWGEVGHILMSANQDNCFLLDDAYYVVV